MADAGRNGSQKKTVSSRQRDRTAASGSEANTLRFMAFSATWRS